MKKKNISNTSKQLDSPRSLDGQLASMKNNANELLAVTDKAVKSIRGYGSEPDKTLDQLGELHIFSPPDNNVYGTGQAQITQPKSFHPRPSVPNPTAALADNVQDSHHDTSVSSIKSMSSRTSTGSSVNSSLLSGGARRVKISAKKLREIKPPLALEQTDSPTSIEDNYKYVDGRQINARQNQPYLIEKHMINGTELSMSEVMTKPPSEDFLSDHSIDKGAIVTGTIPDSGYTTEKMHKPIKSSNATQEDIPSIQDEEDGDNLEQLSNSASDSGT